MTRRPVPLGVLMAVVAGASAYYYNLRSVPQAPDVTTAPVTVGEIVDAVGATGTLEAVTTVQVGTQVSGRISELHADFNSIVRRGQVIARLDPSLFETQVEQARANLIRAQAEVDRLRVALEDARTRLQRSEGLAGRNLIPQSELEAAQVAVRTADAQLRSSQAQLTQAQASLNQAQVNLQHTVITAPIDGIVVSRDVDVGQTVAASMQAPTLYVLAADLAKMRVNASVDEADVGRIRPGQTVRFRVDAYPTEEFSGTVSQVRLQPIVVQNVVTYATVIDVPNPELKLKPGMTATVTIEIARRDHALRVPNSALRFRPTEEMFLALGQEPRRAPTDRASSAGAEPLGQPTPDDTTPTRESAGDGRGELNGERRRAFMEQLASLPQEERERARRRMQERSGRSRSEGAAGGDRPQAADNGQIQPQAISASPASTIDALFGPLPRRESSGAVWLFVDGQLVPARVRLGISDGRNTELLDSELQEGTELVTSLVIPETSAWSGGQSPLLGPQRGRRGPPGVRNAAAPRR